VHIDDLLKKGASQLRAAYTHTPPPGLEPPRRWSGWVVAMSSAVAVFVLIAPVALLLRSHPGVVPDERGAAVTPDQIRTEKPARDPVPEPPDPIDAFPTGGRCARGESISVGEGVIAEAELNNVGPAPFKSAEEAVAFVIDEIGFSFEFDQESSSDVWIAGSSANPDAVIQLSQRDGVDGWFLVAVHTCVEARGAGPSDVRYDVLLEGAEIGDIYTTAYVASASEFQALWTALGAAGDPPVVDFGTSVVFYFGAVESSSCPLGPVEDLVYSEANQRLYPAMSIIVPEGENVACNDDAQRHAVLVAFSRASLPTGPFSLWISSADPPGCCPDGESLISGGELDLSP